MRGELVRFLAAQLRGGDEKLMSLIEKETQPNTRDVWAPTAANFFGRVGGPYMSDLWRDLLDLPADHPTATSFDKLMSRGTVQLPGVMRHAEKAVKARMGRWWSASIE